MKRLDIEKQNKLEPQRIEYAKLELSKKGIDRAQLFSWEKSAAAFYKILLSCKI